MDNYFIKDGYKCNLQSDGSAHPHEDSENLARIFQVAVYRYAARVAKDHSVKCVLDVGCGYGVKLVKYVYPVCSRIVGVDQAHSISWCQQNHAVGEWVEDNIENESPKVKGTFDLIISSDVVEHLPDPDKLLAYIRTHASDKTQIVMSTPERDSMRGKESFGPSPNISHIREWNKDEFSRYISSRGFEIMEHLFVEDHLKPLHLRIRHKLSGYNSKNCQLVLFRLAKG